MDSDPSSSFEDQLVDYHAFLMESMHPSLPVNLSMSSAPHLNSAHSFIPPISHNNINNNMIENGMIKDPYDASAIWDSATLNLLRSLNNQPHPTSDILSASSSSSSPISPVDSEALSLSSASSVGAATDPDRDRDSASAQLSPCPIPLPAQPALSVSLAPPASPLSSSAACLATFAPTASNGSSGCSSSSACGSDIGVELYLQLGRRRKAAPRLVLASVSSTPSALLFNSTRVSSFSYFILDEDDKKYSCEEYGNMTLSSFPSIAARLRRNAKQANGAAASAGSAPSISLTMRLKADVKSCLRLGCNFFYEKSRNNRACDVCQSIGWAPALGLLRRVPLDQLNYFHPTQSAFSSFPFLRPVSLPSQPHTPPSIALALLEAVLTRGGKHWKFDAPEEKTVFVAWTTEADALAVEKEFMQLSMPTPAGISALNGVVPDSPIQAVSGACSYCVKKKYHYWALEIKAVGGELPDKTHRKIGKIDDAEEAEDDEQEDSGNGAANGLSNANAPSANASATMPTAPAAASAMTKPAMTLVNKTSLPPAAATAGHSNGLSRGVPLQLTHHHHQHSHPQQVQHGLALSHPHQLPLSMQMPVGLPVSMPMPMPPGLPQSQSQTMQNPMSISMSLQTQPQGQAGQIQQSSGLSSAPPSHSLQCSTPTLQSQGLSSVSVSSPTSLNFHFNLNTANGAANSGSNATTHGNFMAVDEKPLSLSAAAANGGMALADSQSGLTIGGVTSSLSSTFAKMMELIQSFSFYRKWLSDVSATEIKLAQENPALKKQVDAQLQMQKQSIIEAMENIGLDIEKKKTELQLHQQQGMQLQESLSNAMMSKKRFAPATSSSSPSTSLSSSPLQSSSTLKNVVLVDEASFPQMKRSPVPASLALYNANSESPSLNKAGLPVLLVYRDQHTWQADVSAGFLSGSGGGGGTGGRRQGGNDGSDNGGGGDEKNGGGRGGGSGGGGDGSGKRQRLNGPSGHSYAKDAVVGSVSAAIPEEIPEETIPKDTSDELELDPEIVPASVVPGSVSEVDNVATVPGESGGIPSEQATDKVTEEEKKWSESGAAVYDKLSAPSSLNVDKSLVGGVLSHPGEQRLAQAALGPVADNRKTNTNAAVSGSDEDEDYESEDSSDESDSDSEWKDSTSLKNRRHHHRHRRRSRRDVKISLSSSTLPTKAMEVFAFVSESRSWFLFHILLGFLALIILLAQLHNSDHALKIIRTGTSSLVSALNDSMQEYQNAQALLTQSQQSSLRQETKYYRTSGGRRLARQYQQQQDQSHLQSSSSFHILDTSLNFPSELMSGLSTGSLGAPYSGSQLSFGLRQKYATLRTISSIFDVYVSFQEERTVYDSPPFQNASYLFTRCVETANVSKSIGDYLMTQNNAFSYFVQQQPRAALTRLSSLSAYTNSSNSTLGLDYTGLCSAMNNVVGGFYFLQLMCGQFLDILLAKNPEMQTKFSIQCAYFYTRDGSALASSIPFDVSVCQAFFLDLENNDVSILNLSSFPGLNYLSTYPGVDNINWFFFSRPIGTYPSYVSHTAALLKAAQNSSAHINLTNAYTRSQTWMGSQISEQYYEQAKNVLEVCGEIVTEDRAERRLNILESYFQIPGTVTDGFINSPMPSNVASSYLLLNNPLVEQSFLTQTVSINQSLLLLCFLGTPGVFFILSMFYLMLITALGRVMECLCLRSSSSSGIASNTNSSGSSAKLQTLDRKRHRHRQTIPINAPLVTPQASALQSSMSVGILPGTQPFGLGMAVPPSASFGNLYEVRSGLQTASTSPRGPPLRAIDEENQREKEKERKRRRKEKEKERERAKEEKDRKRRDKEREKSGNRARTALSPRTTAKESPAAQLQMTEIRSS